MLTLAQAIAQQENVNPVYNNPGALMAAPSSYCQNGKTSGGLVIFCTPEDGWGALDNQISLNANRGLTLPQFFGGVAGGYPGYAPAAAGNDPTVYASNVSNWTGIDPTLPLNQADPNLLFSPTFGVSASATNVVDQGSSALLAGFVPQGVDWQTLLLILAGLFVAKKIFIG